VGRKVGNRGVTNGDKGCYCVNVVIVMFWVWERVSSGSSSMLGLSGL
jgi:hypothetical protein